MSRFTSIIARLHHERLSILNESRERRARASAPRAKKQAKISFDSPELEAIFNGLPDDMKELIKKGGR